MTALYSAQQEQFESLSVTGEGFPNDVRGFYQFNNAEVLTANPNYSKSTHESQMLRFNYNYDSKYLLIQLLEMIRNMVFSHLWLLVGTFIKKIF